MRHASAFLRRRRRPGRPRRPDRAPAAAARELGLDFVVVNGENAAGGFGITEKICAELYAAGTDVLTIGNHVWDQREVIGHIDRIRA